MTQSQLPRVRGETPLSENETRSIIDGGKPAARCPRKVADKPPMPANLEKIAAKALKRHSGRHASPGVAVEVVKSGLVSYVVASPHGDRDAWEVMVCDALGTRSVSTAQTFLHQLTELCSQNWHAADVEGEQGEWCPDERELNMILHFVAGIKPRNEMEAALAAQMVAINLMTLKVSARALRGGVVIAEDAAIAGKLARTFVMQSEAMARLKGRKRSTRQTIKVSHEKHIHHHQHVYLEGGGSEIGGQAHEANEPRPSGNCPPAALLSPDQTGNVLPMRRDEWPIAVSQARRGKGIGRT